jgi:hypothetical protein
MLIINIINKTKMAQSKIPKLKDLSGYFFMGIKGSGVESAYEDNTDNNSAIGAGFCSLLESDDKLFDLMSSALLIAIENRNEKNISKTAKKVVKTPVKAVNKK